MKIKWKQIALFFVLLVISFSFLIWIGDLRIADCVSSCNDNPELKCAISGGDIISKCSVSYIGYWHYFSRLWVYLFVYPFIIAILLFLIIRKFWSKIK